MRKLVKSLLGNKPNKDPARVYDRIIIAKRKRYASMEAAVEKVVRLHRKLEHDVFERRAEIARVHDEVRSAARRGDDNRAIALIKHKQVLHENLADAEEELRHFSEDCDQAKRKLNAFADEVRGIERERTKAMAAIATQSAKAKFRAVIDGATHVDESDELERVRTHISDVLAQSRLSDELEGKTLDAELGAIWEDRSTRDARDELAQLKQARRTLNAVSDSA